MLSFLFFLNQVKIKLRLEPLRKRTSAPRSVPVLCAPGITMAALHGAHTNDTRSLMLIRDEVRSPYLLCVNSFSPFRDLVRGYCSSSDCTDAGGRACPAQGRSKQSSHQADPQKSPDGRAPEPVLSTSAPHPPSPRKPHFGC